MAKANRHRFRNTSNYQHFPRHFAKKPNPPGSIVLCHSFQCPAAGRGMPFHRNVPLCHLQVTLGRHRQGKPLLYRHNIISTWESVKVSASVPPLSDNSLQCFFIAFFRFHYNIVWKPRRRRCFIPVNGKKIVSQKLFVEASL